MSKEIETGPRAFPMPCFEDHPNGPCWQTHPMQSGMTLRDNFAGQIVSSLLTKGEYPIRAAQKAYLVADYLIEFREYGHEALLRELSVRDMEIGAYT